MMDQGNLIGFSIQTTPNELSEMEKGRVVADSGDAERLFPCAGVC